MKTALFEKSKKVMVEIASNNLLLEQDKIGFLTTKSSELDYLTFEKTSVVS